MSDRDVSGRFIKGHRGYMGMLGKKHTSEVVERLRNAHLGVKRGPHTKKWNKKISQAHLSKGLSWFGNCEYCDKQFKIYNYRPEARFCSSKCRAQIVPMPTKGALGRVPWNKGLTLKTDSRLKDISENRKGSKNWQYIHGQSKSHKTSWGSAIHKAWRKAVFERDNYTCQNCKQRGGHLQADHIKCFAHHLELRYELSNGRTLCYFCHKSTPNYGMHSKSQCLT